LILTSHQYECSLPQDDAILSGQLTVWEPLYQAIVGEFTNTSDAGIFSGDRNTRQGTKHYSAMALTIRAFLPFACKYIPALDIAIFSLLTMYYGRLHANAGLVSLARSSYIAALSQFRQDLPKARVGPTGTRHIHQALCCTSIALCCLSTWRKSPLRGLAMRHTSMVHSGCCSPAGQRWYETCQDSGSC
jgi:hypothetical protein